MEAEGADFTWQNSQMRTQQLLATFIDLRRNFQRTESVFRMTRQGFLEIPLRRF